MNKKLLLILLIVSLFLLVSCSKNNIEAHYLVAGEEGSVYLIKDDKIVRIQVPSSDLISYSEYTGLDSLSALESLFSIKATSKAKISEENGTKRDEMLSLLSSVTEKENGYYAYFFYANDLRKTKFLSTITELSDDFDDEKIIKEVNKKTKFEYYSTAPITNTASSWDEKQEFIQLWINQIMR